MKLFLIVVFILGSIIWISNSKKSLNYTNPHIDDQQKGFGSFLKWQFTKDRPKITKSVIEQIPFVKTDLEKIHSPEKLPQITWIGHSTVLVQVDGINILTDPIFSERCSPLSFAGPKRLVSPSLDLTNLPPIDYVVISHNHYDHLDLNTVQHLANNPKWVVPLGLKNWFLNHGITNVSELDWWQKFQNGRITITSTPAQHWSGRKVIDSYKTYWCSWAILIDNFKFWFGGDTGYNEFQFAEIGKKLGPFNAAAIPIGSFEPRWFMKNYHINPEEAVKIHQDINSEFSFGIHWGTFILSDESILTPMLEIERLKNEGNIENPFEIFPIGRTKTFDEKINFAETN